jgi:hypothetical protein
MNPDTKMQLSETIYINFTDLDKHKVKHSLNVLCMHVFI